MRRRVNQSSAAKATPPATNTDPQPMDAQWAQHVVDALIKRLYRRVPKSGNKKLGRSPEFCPFSGLNHSQIYQGMEEHADGRPPIRSVSLKEPDEASAARFYSVQSALEYMDYLAHLQAPAVKAAKR